ncbi:hypothetical protein NUKP79_50110 [Klebsiella quasipneumoniae]|jgi:sugar lactone lactonase YvrE|nr:hypothetical protein NUKP79_50110 [Klebsiella quasipneumoniae]
MTNEIRISSSSEYTAWVKDASKEKEANLKQLALLYLLDPDGHKLELHVGDLSSRLAQCREKPYSGMRFGSEK